VSEHPRTTGKPLSSSSSSVETSVGAQERLRALQAPLRKILQAQGTIVPVHNCEFLPASWVCQHVEKALTELESLLLSAPLQEPTLREAFEAGHFAWPSPELPNRDAQFKYWLARRRSAPLQENMQEQDFARGHTKGFQEAVVPHRNDGEK
jgi:hypothetical protein